MHCLSNYTPYSPSTHSLTGESKVLAWSVKTGYYFSVLGFITDIENTKIIGVEK